MYIITRRQIQCTVATVHTVGPLEDNGGPKNELPVFQNQISLPYRTDFEKQL